VFPYLAMLAAPGAFALTGARRTGILLLLVALLYWVMIGFRFQVGADCLLLRPDSTTSWLSFIASARCRPRKPVPPVMRTRWRKLENPIRS
jgi:hypothetical protein